MTEEPAAPQQSTEDLSGEQVDLSGTYSGRVMTTGGHEMSGNAELTITGNTFTLTGEGMTHSGRVYTVLTRGDSQRGLLLHGHPGRDAAHTPRLQRPRAQARRTV